MLSYTPSTTLLGRAIVGLLSRSAAITTFILPKLRLDMSPLVANKISYVKYNIVYDPI